jgi:Tfp pilus assembly protein PilV
LRKPASHSRSIAGFTLVEVMMAAIILTVGFVGMIQAVTICSGMMNQARRQTLAAQILSNETEQLRLKSWTTISGLPLGTTTVGIDRQLWPIWNASFSYSSGSVVSYNGGYYRCTIASAGDLPTDAGHWIATSSSFDTDIFATLGASFSMTRTVSDIAVGSMREITFTVNWVVTTSRRDSSGNPVKFNYTRSNSAWYGKYGLNLSYQRS